MAPGVLKNGAQCCFTNFDSRLLISSFFCESTFHFTILHSRSFLQVQRNLGAKNILPCLSHVQKITGDEHALGLGFKSSRILVRASSILMDLDFKIYVLPDLDWINDNIVVNFSATFGSIFGLQINLLH